MMDLLFVGVGGFLGSCARYLLTRASQCLNMTFPLGTFVSNIVAGLFIGLIIGLERQSMALSPRTKLFLTTGLLGGLSTFSTFSMETVNLFMDGRYLMAVGNVALNLGISLACVVLGLLLARVIIKA